MEATSKRFTFFKGRVALHALLNAAGVGPGDRVLLPGYTCVVVPNAILYRGAEPVFLDIDPTNYNLDPEQLRNWLDLNPSGQNKVLIVQHTYGIPCNMDLINPLARKHNLLVIEDSCHAIGSAFKGTPVGSLGHAAFFSSQWSKPLTTGLGGWATVTDPNLAIEMERIFSEYSSPRTLETIILYFQHLAFRAAYRPRLFWLIQGLYRKLGNLGLAIGSSTQGELSSKEPHDFMKRMGRPQERKLHKLLESLDQVEKVRKHQKSLVDDLLSSNGLAPLILPNAYDPVVLRYPVRVGNKEEVLASARKQKIQLGDWFVSPVHPNLNHWDMAGYRKGSCPVAEKVSKTTINIPLGPHISDKEIEKTVSFLGRQAEPVGF